MNNQNKQNLEILKKDFVAFIFVLWKALNLPRPTKCQIDMCKTLADTSNTHFILQAFRGIGKSFITCGFVVWSLWNNPQLKILIVSANKERADANSKFIKDIIHLLPFLRELIPDSTQRNSMVSFDVGGAKPDHSPSVKSVGITGQLTGSRADLIIADDVEIPNNSTTHATREALRERVKEFGAIIKPLPTSRVIYLGTPQCEMTLYKELEENRGYKTVIYPAYYPRDNEEYVSYGNRLAALLKEEYDENPEALQGMPTDPVRFDLEELRRRELEYGKAGFMLQFMLNPNLSDTERLPLNYRDLITCELDRTSSPLTFQWLPSSSNTVEDVPNVGLSGDMFHTYHSVSSHTAPYERKILMIDPSGRGKDETGWCVLYTLNGYVFLMDAGGYKDGYGDKTLKALANKAKEWEVHTVVYESNFGDGMFGKVFEPVLLDVHKCNLEEVRAKGMKELRICDTLEPLMGSHKLVVNKECVRMDYKTAVDNEGKHEIKYSLFYQLSRISRERGALANDDRLDSLALGVEYLREAVRVDAEKNQDTILEDWLMRQMGDTAITSNTIREQLGVGVSLIYGSDIDDYNSYGSWL